MSKTIAILSTYLPTRCGIATYSEALAQELSRIDGIRSILKVPIVLSSKGHMQIATHMAMTNQRSYVEVAQQLNKKADCVVLQHEFKLFGGRYGTHVLDFMRNLKCPLITTFHTVSPHFKGSKRVVFQEICERSNAIVCHTRHSANIVTRYCVDQSKIHVIPHGVPDVPLTMSKKSFYGARTSRKMIFVSFGHVRKAKGYEHAIRALSRLHHDGFEFIYYICGEPHPRRKSAVAYLSELINLKRCLGLDDHIFFINQFLTEKHLIDLIQSADIGILPYTRREQSTSGTLSFILACGRPVIATNFRHAEEIITPFIGKIAKNCSEEGLYRVLKEVASLPSDNIEAMMKNAHSTAVEWNWRSVSKEYYRIAHNLIE